MEAAPQVTDPDVVPPTPPSAAEKDPGTHDVAAARQETQAAAVEAFAQDREGLEPEDERDALDWLFAGAPAIPHDVPVTMETPGGPQKLKWTVTAVDGRKIDAIEVRNTSDTTGQLDVISANCQLVAEATIHLEARPGHVVKIDSPEFLTMRVRNRESGEISDHRHASSAEAIEAQFRKQLGLVAGVAREVRRLSGYDPERVGSAQRRVIGAAGNS